MNESKIQYEKIKEEEEKFEFEKFSRSDALKLGLTIIEKAKAFSDPITVEITINQLVVFRYFADGSLYDSDLWLKRKRNSVELMAMSSLRFMYWLEFNGSNLNDRKLDEKDYAACGGGFPIKIREMDVVGSICVSGLPNHLDDHQLIIEAIEEL